jgi:hypothetical protein
MFWILPVGVAETLVVHAAKVATSNAMPNAGASIALLAVNAGLLLRTPNLPDYTGD